MDAESGLYSAYYNPYHLSRIQAEIEASAAPAERRCVCCLLIFGATCGAVTVAVGFYVRTPAITWPVVTVGLLGVIAGIVLAHRQATGRGWGSGRTSAYTLGALVLRRRQQQDEQDEEERRRQAEQVEAARPQPWQPSPLQPWRVAQVCGARYHVPVYCACPLEEEVQEEEGSGSGSSSDDYSKQAPVAAKGEGGGRDDSLLRLSSSDESSGRHGLVSVEMGPVEGAGDTASGSGSTPTASSSASSRGSSTQDFAGGRGGAEMAAGGAGPALGLASVCGWAGEGAMVCGLPQAGLDGRVDVRPVLVLQPHWQHPAQQHPAQPQHTPALAALQGPALQGPQPPQLDLRQASEQGEDWTDAASETGESGGRVEV